MGLTSCLTTLDKLSFFAWNINGLFSKSLGNKLQSTDFLNMVNRFDFIIITEPWKCTDVEVAGYRCIIQDGTVSKSGGRNAGGIICYIRIYFKIGFQLPKRLQIFFGSKSTKVMPKQ